MEYATKKKIIKGVGVVAVIGVGVLAVNWAYGNYSTTKACKYTYGVTDGQRYRISKCPPDKTYFVETESGGEWTELQHMGQRVSFTSVRKARAGAELLLRVQSEALV
jgi:hypothetical protein